MLLSVLRRRSGDHVEIQTATPKASVHALPPETADTNESMRVRARPPEAYFIRTNRGSPSPSMISA